MALEKNVSFLYGPIFFELTYIAPKENYLPYMAFCPFLTLDGVKSIFYPGEKNKMQNFARLLYI
jgi:hypothetical protein